MTDGPRNPIDYRPAELVLELISYLADADDAVRESEVYRHFADRAPKKTLEATLYDLRRFGALYRAGPSKSNRRPATLRATALGLAWLDRTVLRRPGKLDPVDVELDQVLDVLAEILATAPVDEARDGWELLARIGYEVDPGA